MKEGNCYIDLSKQIGTADSIRWNFHHALAKLNVQIIAAADTVTEGVAAYETTEAKDLATATKIYLRSIDFTGFATRGALNLHSEATAVDYKLKPNWTNYDGTDLTAANVTFYDGLKDLKEGYTDNIAPNEKPQGLNPVLIEEPTTKKWADKRQGIPTKAYANLFAGAKTASDAIFVIPTNERMTITVVYDVMTRDTLLNQNLSDGFTKGSRVQNKISQTLQDLKLEAGKAYTIKLVVGIESVKVTVKVAEWDDTEAEQKVDLPYNPKGENQQGGDTTDKSMKAGESYDYSGNDGTEDIDGTAGPLVEDGDYFTWTTTEQVTRDVVYTVVPAGSQSLVRADYTSDDAWDAALTTKLANGDVYVTYADGTIKKFIKDATNNPEQETVDVDVLNRIPKTTKQGDTVIPQKKVGEEWVNWAYEITFDEP